MYGPPASFATRKRTASDTQPGSRPSKKTATRDITLVGMSFPI
jgi:hypothetical protein